MGLHFPVTYPHWVQNQNEVSISFSITFRTPDLDKRRTLYSMNHSLRERGYSPTPVGQNALRDSLYYNLYRVYRKLTTRSQPGANEAALASDELLAGVGTRHEAGAGNRDRTRVQGCPASSFPSLPSVLIRNGNEWENSPSRVPGTVQTLLKWDTRRQLAS